MGFVPIEIAVSNRARREIEEHLTVLSDTRPMLSVTRRNILGGLGVQAGQERDADAPL